MTTQILGCRVNNKVRAKLERTNQIWCGDSVVHNQRNTEFVSHACHALNIKNVIARVRQRLAVEELRIWLNGCAPRVQVIGIVNKCDLNTHFG